MQSLFKKPPKFRRKSFESKINWYRDNFYLPIQAKAVITFSYFLSTLLSYALMLVVMSFNGGLFLATCFGLSFGYFIFGYMKKRGAKIVKEAAGAEKIYNPEGDKCWAEVDFEWNI